MDIRTKDSSFNLQEPCVVFDHGGSVIYLFTSRHKFTAREKEAKEHGEAELSDSKEEDSHSHYFTKHGPEFIAQLPTEDRERLGCVITRRRALTANLLKILTVAELTANKVAFDSMRVVLVTKQKMLY